jgi:hypothetical protein
VWFWVLSKVTSVTECFPFWQTLDFPSSGFMTVEGVLVACVLFPQLTGLPKCLKTVKI